MIQGGDPTVKICLSCQKLIYLIKIYSKTKGTGRGGSSIYGKTFPDEIHPNLKHTGNIFLT